ncbi:hypothetical protein F4776DRAFT_626227 [Hypoxylon sp. NC0597]|nr:hypothetical protein F4776DRAFT_626227 [Hypoxylon sp. NC0597]
MSHLWEALLSTGVSAKCFIPCQLQSLSCEWAKYNIVATPSLASISGWGLNPLEVQHFLVYKIPKYHFRDKVYLYGRIKPSWCYLNADLAGGINNVVGRESQKFLYRIIEFILRFSIILWTYELIVKSR